MSKHSVFSAIYAGALALSLAAGQSNTDNRLQPKPDETAGKVDVKSVVKVFLAKDTPGYSIAYEYDFPQRRSVYIRGFGTVPGRGSFRYLTAGTLLEFRDSPTGEVLARVPLQETVIVAARPPLLPTPEVMDFPQDSQMTENSARACGDRTKQVFSFRTEQRLRKGGGAPENDVHTIGPEECSCGSHSASSSIIFRSV
jgi:hypothetical protein